MRKILFDYKAFDQFKDWAKTDTKILIKICELLSDCQRNPFQGLGKPEPLKHDFKGYWSRHINQEHRLVYKVTEDYIIVASCRFHYNKHN